MQNTGRLARVLVDRHPCPQKIIADFDELYTQMGDCSALVDAVKCATDIGRFQIDDISLLTDKN